MTLDERTTTPYAAALLRVTQGVALLAHGGLLKLGVFGVAGTMGFFGSIGYPPALALVVIIAEVVGGLALIAGFKVRWVSLALIPIMVGAVVFHLPNGWVFSAPKGGWEFPAFWTAVLLVQAGLGAGAYSLDAALRRAPQPVAA